MRSAGNPTNANRTMAYKTTAKSAAICCGAVTIGKYTPAGAGRCIEWPRGARLGQP